MEASNSSNGGVLDKNNFRVLIVYPNLPLMMLVPVAVGLFTKIFKNHGYVTDLFDTTHYQDDDQTTYMDEREEMLNSRVTDKSELNYPQKTGKLEAFRRKVQAFKPNFIIYAAVVEDSFFLTLSLLRAIKDLEVLDD